MRFFVPIMILISLIHLSVLATPPKCSDIFKRNLLKLVADASSRYQYPDIEFKLDAKTTNEVFEALTTGQVTFAVSIFNRTIRVPQWLLEKFGPEVTAVKVSFVIWNTGQIKNGGSRSTWPENDGVFSIRISDANKYELSSAGERAISDALGGVFANAINVPVTNRSLVEGLLPRSRLYEIIRSAAEKFGEENSISQGNRVSQWYIQNQREHGFDTSEIFIEMNGLTKAEFYTVVNEFAAYLDGRARAN